MADLINDLKEFEMIANRKVISNYENSKILFQDLLKNILII